MRAAMTPLPTHARTASVAVVELLVGCFVRTCVPMSILGMNDDAIRSLVWNLRTWPLELVQWETQNSHRLDIQFNPEPDR